MPDFDTLLPRRSAPRIRFHDGIQPVEIELDSNAEQNRLRELAVWGYRLLYPPATASGLLTSIFGLGCSGLAIGGAIALWPLATGLPTLLLVAGLTMVLRNVYRSSPGSLDALSLRLALFTLPLMIAFTAVLL